MAWCVAEMARSGQGVPAWCAKPCNDGKEVNAWPQPIDLGSCRELLNRQKRLVRKARQLAAKQDLTIKIQSQQQRINYLEDQIRWWTEWYSQTPGWGSPCTQVPNGTADKLLTALGHASHGLRMKGVRDEVETRLRHIDPVIEEKVVAAALLRHPRVSGTRRACRNSAEHNCLRFANPHQPILKQPL